MCLKVFVVESSLSLCILGSISVPGKSTYALPQGRELGRRKTRKKQQFTCSSYSFAIE